MTPLQTIFLNDPYAGLAHGCVAAYALNDTSGADQTGRVNVLSPQNTPTVAQGKIENAAQFVAASSQFYNIGDNADLSITGDMTIDGWVYLDTLATGIIAAKNNISAASSIEYALYFSVADNKFRLTAGNGTTFATVIALAFGAAAAGQWYYVCGRHINGVGLRISVNAGVEDFIALTVGIQNGTGSFRIGGDNVAGRFLNGRADDVRVWKRLLTENEIAARHAGGAGSGRPFRSLVGAGFANPTAPVIALTAPTQYRVFQRSGSTGTVVITGALNNLTDDVEARWNSAGAYTTIATAANGNFSGSLTGLTEGHGTLEVRAKNNTSVTASVANVGIGDVFIVAGQSNPSGRGTNSQTYSGSPGARLFGNDYQWKNLADPTDSASGQIDSVSNDSANPTGSVWPLIATSYLTSTGLPIAFVPCAKGSTGIAAHWQPGANHQDRTTLYGSMVYRALQTGAKCVLWWQGESDMGMSQATYNSNLDTIANAVNTDLGCKLMPCKLQHTTQADADQNAINAAIAEAWGDNTNVLTGPDLTGIDCAPQDTVHLVSDAKLSSAAALWWTAFQAAFGYA